MSTARPSRAPRWLTVLLLLVLLPVTLVPPLLDGETNSWWPTAGLAAACLLLSPRRHRIVLVGVMVVLVAPTASLAYDLPLLLGALTTTAFVLPALLVAHSLGCPGADRTEVALVSEVAGARYYLTALLSSGVAGAVSVVLVLAAGDPLASVQWFLVTTLGTFTSLLVLLPLLVPTARVPAIAPTLELSAQRLLVLTTTALLFVPGSPPVLSTSAFPLLGWAALRASRRETHVQVAGFAVMAHVSIAVPALQDPESAVFPELLVTVPLHVFLAALCLLVVPLALAVERLSVSHSAAERTETTVRRMLDSAGSTVFIATDVSGRVHHFNEGAGRILGYGSDDVLGRLPTMFHTEQEVARQAEALGVPPDLDSVVARQIETGERRDWEFVRGDGDTCTVSVGYNVVRDSEQSVILTIASGEDVTERIRAQQALETALEREHRSVLALQEVDHVKQELVSNVSHELRTPITSIAGYAELLSDSSLGDLTRPQRDALERIERNAHRLQSLVDDLLTMSRAEAGRLQLSRTHVDLSEVARGGWDLVEGQLQHRDLERVLVLPSDPVPVVGDAGALERIVVNLVGNAIKFTPDGGSVTLALSRCPQGGARLVVRDTGIGISAEDQDKLFTRFFRSQQATDRAIQGTGLGLSIVQTLVAQHGGRVLVRSRPGEGTRVTVELPPP